MKLLAPDAPLQYPVPAPRDHAWVSRFRQWHDARPTFFRIFGLVAIIPTIISVYVLSQHGSYIDFRVYHMGAQHLTDPNLYRARITEAPHLPFTYPPVGALFFWIFGLLPFRTAALFWSTCNIAALWLLLLASLRLTKISLTPAQRTTAALLLLSPLYFMEPFLQNFHFGQINLVLAVATLYDVVAERTGRLPRGVLLGLATAIKLIPGVFILYLLARRQYRAVAVAATSFLVSNGVMLALNHRATLDYWRHYAFNPSHMGGVVYNSNQSIQGALQRLSGQMLSHALLTALEVVVLIYGVTIAVRFAARSSELAALLTVGVTGDLVSPISWSHHLIWFIPLLLWLCVGDDRPRTGPLWAFALAMACWLRFIWKAPYVGGTTLHWNWWQEILGNSYFFAMVAFLVLTPLAWSRRDR